MPLTALTPADAARLRAARLNYPDAGRTAGELPGGYRHLRRSAPLGTGPQAFTDAAAALMGWQLHLRAGIGVSADGTATAGTHVLLHARIGPVRLNAPCRVVYVVDEPARRGFAYGTLDGHQESGEESFIIRQDDSGAVSLVITAFSRPATTLARAAGPLGRAIQHQITGRYLRALQPLLGGNSTKPIITTRATGQQTY
jgi:uncharacterized protein (UPF0548 family)